MGILETIKRLQKWARYDPSQFKRYPENSDYFPREAATRLCVVMNTLNTRIEALERCVRTIILENKYANIKHNIREENKPRGL